MLPILTTQQQKQKTRPEKVIGRKGKTSSCAIITLQKADTSSTGAHVEIISTNSLEPLISIVVSFNLGCGCTQMSKKILLNLTVAHLTEKSISFNPYILGLSLLHRLLGPPRQTKSCPKYKIPNKQDEETVLPLFDNSEMVILGH